MAELGKATTEFEIHLQAKATCLPFIANKIIEKIKLVVDALQRNTAQMIFNISVKLIKFLTLINFVHC